ncbi:MAG: winged helix-turn-helix domain-containing protein [Caldilineaceae bacterium]|nr:winged helix-turn-helix domain-containing protein [Caldilineaceae bacterium]
MKFVNPFFSRGPIRDARFFWNRNEEMEQARGLLTQGQSVSIVGPRRIGKSSLLLQLGNRVQENPVDAHWIYFNCEAWSTAPPESLYSLLAEAIAADGIALPGIAPPLATQLDYRTFRETILNLTRTQGCLIFLLDEFESLAMNPHLGADFFSGLRALATGGQVVFVTVSARSLGWLTFAEPSALSSPFFNIFAQINLYPFTVDSAAAMLVHFSRQAGAAFAPGTVDFILNLSGPHPFFSQIAAYIAFEQMDASTGALTVAAQERISADFLTQVESHWHYAWQELPLTDRKQLALSTALQDCPAALTRRLRGLALMVDGEDGPRLLSPALGDFFARQPVAGVIHAPPLVIDEGQHRVLVHGQEIELHGLEYELLRLLAIHVGDIVLQETLHATLWPGEATVDAGNERLKSVVKGLRRKLGDHADLVQNERGRGYALMKSRREWQTQ